MTDQSVNELLIMIVLDFWRLDLKGHVSEVVVSCGVHKTLVRDDDERRGRPAG